MSGLQLPPGFVLGTGSAAIQIEGALAEDGRGPSIWDDFPAQDGSSPAVAADHFHRYREDIELVQKMGSGAFRMSLAWPRILPEGRGRPNQAALDHYDRVIDALLEVGVKPMVTLYHWDLPLALEADGGWLNRATIEAFAEYAQIAGERYADRVEHWIPISEPSSIASRGYGLGDHAPGRMLGFDMLPAAHHLLVAHGRAAIELRRAGATSIGCANNHSPMWPATDDEADVGATKLFDQLWNGLYLEPMLFGRYPRDLAPLLEEVNRPGDAATIRQPLDFYGVNYYSPLRIAAGDEGSDQPFRFMEVLGYPVSASGWSAVPHALQEWLILTKARYRAAMPPLVITECGFSLGGDDLEDDSRIDYLRTHLEAVATAVHRGVDVRGFYVWSLLDSWEWTTGVRPHYGLVHVDTETLERTPKKSFGWYADLIASQPRD